jgi:serine/threonine protein kinase
MSDFWVGPCAAPDTYRLVSLLGGGGEGEVWKAVLPLSGAGRRTVAIKIAKPKPGQQQQWERFGHLLRSLSHPGLVRVTDVFLGPAMHREGVIAGGEPNDPDSPNRYAVMDYIDGTNLREWAAENTDATASQRLRLLGMVAAALDEMHSGASTEVAVAHGDVKPANIVVRADGAAILVDLGLARLADSTGVAGRSAAYAAPELRVHGALSTPAADRYAFAVTTAQVLTGQAPPVGADGWLDTDALRALLSASPLTARRHTLVHRILTMLSAPPEARTSPLRPWLDGAVESISQVTSTGLPVTQSSESSQAAPATAQPVRSEPEQDERAPTAAGPGAAGQPAAPETADPESGKAAAGERFGPYVLDRLLGRGGMGEVYRATDTNRNRVVALKRLPAGMAGDPEFNARFREESTLAAQLNEPHIIPIHDFGEIDGRLYIDMRLVEGTDLARLLTEHGALSPARAVSITRQIAAALDAAHSAGLIHRDVKPANVLLRSAHTDTGTDFDDGGDDFAYLADFGIARAASSTRPGLTDTGGAIGSVTYMAPERFSGHSDQRSDIYSLGCLLYETLTGQHPFQVADTASAIHAHLYRQPPRPSETNPTIPVALDSVIATAMAKQPDQRYPSAGALAAAARNALSLAAGTTVPDAANAATSHIPATPHLPWADAPTEPIRRGGPIADPRPDDLPTAPPRDRRPRPRIAALVGAGVLLLGLLGVAGYQLLSHNSTTGPGQDPSLAITQEPIQTPGANPFTPSVGHDVPNVQQPAGSHGAYAGGTPGLYGGTMHNSECDRAAMISFLQTNPDKAAAWAAVENITPTDIPAYINQLTPVILRGDTTVTNHGFTAGQATTLHSVLQTGTAVLIDPFGVPRARCYCGNPLTPPSPPAGLHYNRAAWSGFDRSHVLGMQPTPAPLPGLTLIDLSTNSPFYRPTGTSGEQDQAIPPVATTPPTPTRAPRPVQIQHPPAPTPTHVATPEPTCPDGQHLNSGICRPDKTKNCPDGQHREHGKCIHEKKPCPDGTHREHGDCVPDKKPPPPCREGSAPGADGECPIPPCPPGRERHPNGECSIISKKPEPGHSDN